MSFKKVLTLAQINIYRNEKRNGECILCVRVCWIRFDTIQSQKLNCSLCQNIKNHPQSIVLLFYSVRFCCCFCWMVTFNEQCSTENTIQYMLFDFVFFIFENFPFVFVIYKSDFFFLFYLWCAYCIEVFYLLYILLPPLIDRCVVHIHIHLIHMNTWIEFCLCSGHTAY